VTLATDMKSETWNDLAIQCIDSCQNSEGKKLEEIVPNGFDLDFDETLFVLKEFYWSKCCLGGQMLKDVE